MQGKYIFVIAFFGFLFAGMGSAVAAENASQESSYGVDLHSSQTAQDEATTNQAANTEMADSAGQSEQSQTNNTSEMAESGNVTRGREAMQTGRVVGRLVGASGTLQGYVIRTSEAGANRYVFVPKEYARVLSETESQTGMTTHRQAGQGTKGAGTMQRQHLLKRMYEQLLKQSVQIRLLREQLAEQQLSSNSGTTGSEKSSALQGLLDQVAHIVVDRSGHVQAIVLESGVILKSNEWDNRAPLTVGGSFQGAGATSETNKADSSDVTGQRRQAIIIFKPR